MILVALLGGAPMAQASDDDVPVRLADALGLPDDITLELDHRSRVEALANDFRAGGGDDVAWFMRTRLRLGADRGIAGVFFEGMDARRIDLAGEGRVNTGHVNALDLLQFGVRLGDEAVSGATWEVRVGRLTLDVGTRRLFARNAYRNTINAFTGLDARVADDRGHARLGMLVPMQRRPDDAAGLASNAVVPDRVLWGRPLAFVEGVREGLPGDVSVHGLLVGVYEVDTDRAQSRDRRLITPSLRVVRGPEPGRLDAEVELIGQVGQSRPSADPTAATQAHLAGYARAAAGWTLGGDDGRVRLSTSFTLATGDRDPDDDVQQRFDTLYGARRFEYGPTGTYGAIARANLVSPEIRVQASRGPVSGFIAGRHVALASSRDAWTTASLQDPTGDSGAAVGQQLEGRVRWEVAPKNLRLEAGAVRLWRDRFARQAPGAPQGADPFYAYAQVIAWL